MQLILKKAGCEWAVRVGQRLPSKFEQSGAARELNLVEAPAMRGGLPSTWPTQPVFGWCCSQRFGGLIEVVKSVAIFIWVVHAVLMLFVTEFYTYTCYICVEFC